MLRAALPGLSALGADEPCCGALGQPAQISECDFKCQGRHSRCLQKVSRARANPAWTDGADVGQVGSETVLVLVAQPGAVLGNVGTLQYRTARALSHCQGTVCT